jgi:hypothetical protein
LDSGTSLSANICSERRQKFLDGIENPTAADKMLADTAVLAYRNVCGSRAGSDRCAS